MDKKLTYKDAGVDIDTADKFVQKIKDLVKPTLRHEVVGGIGGFGSLFALNTQKYREPLLVSSTDGVGTKLRIASMMDKHDTVGIDLVAMCVNDIIVMGAEPLFMLDYISIGKIDTTILTEVMSGIVAGCTDTAQDRSAGCGIKREIFCDAIGIIGADPGRQRRVPEPCQSRRHALAPDLADTLPRHEGLEGRVLALIAPAIASLSGWRVCICRRLPRSTGLRSAAGLNSRSRAIYASRQTTPSSRSPKRRSARSRAGAVRSDLPR